MNTWASVSLPFSDTSRLASATCIAGAWMAIDADQHAAEPRMRLPSGSGDRGIRRSPQLRARFPLEGSVSLYDDSAHFRRGLRAV